MIKNAKLTHGTRSLYIKQLQEMDLTKPMRLNIDEWSSKRSLPANAAYNAWIAPIADFMALTIPEATRYIKLDFALPILFADEYMGPLIGEGLNATGFFELSHEAKLLRMDKTPVTRLFDTKMHKKLRDDLQHFFGVQGLCLDYK